MGESRGSHRELKAGSSWPEGWSPTRAAGYVLAAFLVVFTGFAIVLQVQSGEPPETSGSVIDVFNSALFWMVAVLAIIMASARTQRRGAFVAWVAASAAAAGLAIDEVFEFHERTRQVIGEDDWSKIVMWGGAVAALAILWRLEHLTRGAKTSLFVGISLHTAYLLSDLGDGDFFDIPVSESALAWAEEILEFLAMQAYLVAVVLVVVSAVVAPLSARERLSSEEPARSEAH